MVPSAAFTFLTLIHGLGLSVRYKGPVRSDCFPGPSGKDVRQEFVHEKVAFAVSACGLWFLGVHVQGCKGIDVGFILIPNSVASLSKDVRWDPLRITKLRKLITIVSHEQRKQRRTHEHPVNREFLHILDASVLGVGSFGPRAGIPRGGLHGA